jgi:uncharacterized protein YabE (DUF348 family)
MSRYDALPHLKPRGRNSRVAWPPELPAPLRPWASLLAFGAVAAAAALAYLAAPVPVTVAVDGQTMSFETRAGTVRDVLLEHNVSVMPIDLVVPAPSARVHAGEHISVQRAQSVLVRADGHSTTLRTHAETAAAVLQEAGVELGSGDAVMVNGQRWPADARMPGETIVHGQAGVRTTTASQPRRGLRSVMRREPAPPAPVPTRDAARPSTGAPAADGTWTVDVLRATDVRVIENGIPVPMQLAGRTVGEALEAAGFALFDEDIVRPDRAARLDRAPGIVIERAVPFVLDLDGSSRDVRAVADTVGDALVSAGIEISAHDYSIPEAGSPLVHGMSVQVVRVKEDILVQEVAIAYATDLQPDPGMALDSRSLVRAGEPGLKTQTIRITYEDGEEIDREVVTETTGTPRSAPWYGLTRLGWQVHRGVVATDPRVVPLRTNLYVPGYGPATAADTGGGVRNYMIDLGFTDDNYESWHEWLEVYFVEPLPDKIRWVLP